MSYNIEELELKDNSNQEQIRTRKIFEDLKTKAEKNEKLTEHEKDFFCSGIRLSVLDDGSMNDYECCDNFNFKNLYLIYFKDLLGLSNYEKVKELSVYNVGQKEIKKDINYLAKIEKEWLIQINKTNHSEELLQQISIESRNELKSARNNKGYLLFNRQKINYKRQIRSLVLQSKYVYLTALQIYEVFSPHDFILTLNGQSIEITEYSIVHILNRHFAQVTKLDSTKSFHNSDFKPKYLNIQLKNIFDEIDKSGLTHGMSINKVAFKYKGISYQVWINERDKQIKGKGNVKYNRLETFYPIEEPSELSKINTDFDLTKINEDLSIYIKKKK